MLIVSGSAWTAVAGFAPPAPLAISPTTAAQSLSLLQIQEQEQEYLEKAKKPTTRSFAEILEQEEKDRKHEERTAAEVEYDRWLQQEIARNEGSSSATGAQEGKRGKARARGGQRKVPNRGTAHVPPVARNPATVRIDDDPIPAGQGHDTTSARGRGGGRGGRGGGRGRGGPPAPVRGGFNGNAPVFQPAASTAQGAAGTAPTHTHRE